MKINLDFITTFRRNCQDRNRSQGTWVRREPNRAWEREWFFWPALFVVGRAEVERDPIEHDRNAKFVKSPSSR
ncbi:MAG: hypothetical protein AAGF12_37720 [Myxococcota bacterium]